MKFTHFSYPSICFVEFPYHREITCTYTFQLVNEECYETRKKLLKQANSLKQIDNIKK